MFRVENYLLANYNLSKYELLQSVFISEYGLRHWAHSKKQTPYKWGHKMIAVIELCPLIGLIATIIEGLIASCIAHKEFESPSRISLTKQQWLFKGNQAGCNGPVVVSNAEKVFAKLNTQPSRGIKFNQSKILSFINGGTCTAMSLDFLESYFRGKNISIREADAQSNRLVNYLMEIGSNFASSSQEMRDRQAAYNTIEVELSGDDIDYSKNKVQSLANYHAFDIADCSQEIDVDQLEDESAISHELALLPDGAFFIRILQPANNEKLEECGHSLAYIKEQGLGVFYDPNYGARHLLPSEHAKIIFEGFKNCLRSFQVSKARFYRICPIGV